MCINRQKLALLQENCEKMVTIEIFVYVCIASIMAFCANVMKKKGLFKKLDLIYFSVLLTLIISQIIITALIFSPILPQTGDSNPSTILICIGAILALGLIYVITCIVESSTETHEYARKFTLSAMFIILGASFCAILIQPSETDMDLYRMPFALALCIGMVYYPPALDQLIGRHQHNHRQILSHKNMSSKISQELQRVKLTLTASANTPISYRKMESRGSFSEQCSHICLRWNEVLIPFYEYVSTYIPHKRTVSAPCIPSEKSKVVIVPCIPHCSVHSQYGCTEPNTFTGDFAHRFSGFLRPSVEQTATTRDTPQVSETQEKTQQVRCFCWGVSLLTELKNPEITSHFQSTRGFCTSQ